MFGFQLKRRALEEQERRRNRSSTFTDPLVPTEDMKEFLTAFYKKVYTDQQQENYKNERLAYPNLESHFDILVPSIVSYEDFWKRHDYRCDLDRIMHEMRNSSQPSISGSVANMKQRIIDISIPPERKHEASPPVQPNLNGISKSIANMKERIIDISIPPERKHEASPPVQPKHNGNTSRTPKGTAGTQDLLNITSTMTKPSLTMPPDSEDSSRGEESSVQNNNVHVYPESPERESEHDNQNYEEDDRLVGASIFLLNNVDDDITKFIETLGGTITNTLEDATHVLWIPTNNNHEDYVACIEASQAAALSIPVVNADIWLPRMANLQWDEHWSDIDYQEFQPIINIDQLEEDQDEKELQLSLQLIQEQEELKEKEDLEQIMRQIKEKEELDQIIRQIQVQEAQEEQNIPKRETKAISRVLALTAALVVVFVLAITSTDFLKSIYPSPIEEICRPVRPGTFLELFCHHMGADPRQKVTVKRIQRKDKTVKRKPWWMRLFPKLRKKSAKA